MSDIIFNVSSPLGKTVICTSHQWNQHIIHRHRNMSGKENLVQDAVENPDIIFQSGEYSDRDVYFACNNSNSMYTKVIVENNMNNNNSSVITAFIRPDIAGNIDEGVVKYVKH